MTEGVGEDDVAAGIGQLSSLVVALLALGNVGDDLVLHAQLFTGFLSGVDEVQVIGGVLIMEHDEADLKVGSGLGGSIGLGLVAFGSAIESLLVPPQAERARTMRETQEQRKKLLHFNKSSSNLILCGIVGWPHRVQKPSLYIISKKPDKCATPNCLSNSHLKSNTFLVKRADDYKRHA